MSHLYVENNFVLGPFCSDMLNGGQLQ